MEIFQTIWTALTMPNETLSAILYFPMYFVDAITNMLLFTTLFDIKASKKAKIIYVIGMVILAFISRTFIPDPYATLIDVFTGFIFIKFVLKANLVKTLLSLFTPIVLSIILELFMIQFYSIALKIPFDTLMIVPIYRTLFTLSIYLCIYILYRIIRYFKFHINLEHMNKKNKILLKDSRA